MTPIVSIECPECHGTGKTPEPWESMRAPWIKCPICHGHRTVKDTPNMRARLEQWRGVSGCMPRQLTPKQQAEISKFPALLAEAANRRLVEITLESLEPASSKEVQP